MNKTILLGHGSGGKMTHELIEKFFIRHFSNSYIDQLTDSAILSMNDSDIAFTTDSYVVDPIFFPGGDIGKLAVCGTVNDLAVSGATPLWLSASFIIEEGFEINNLEKIIKSMVNEVKATGIQIVTGDTKIVNKGKCDKIFITTSGIGKLNKKHIHIGKGERIKPGDKIIINGTLADHGMAIMGSREGFSFSSDIISDAASLNHLINKVLLKTDNVHFMRDLTRGGLATVLAEIIQAKKYGIEIEEDQIPVKESVRGMCELLGFDPMLVANEGKIIIIVDKNDAKEVLELMKKDEYGRDAMIIGEIVEQHSGLAVLKTQIGSSRIIDMLSGEQLPRIC